MKYSMVELVLQFASGRRPEAASTEASDESQRIFFGSSSDDRVDLVLRLKCAQGAACPH